MKITNSRILGFFLLIVFHTSIIAQEVGFKTVTVEGKKMAYKTFNLENRRAGEPILVFEPGLGGGNFDPILPLLPKNIAGIQYDRNGIGQSEPDPKIVADSHLVQRLHKMLQTLNIKPPYLLVGHSVGGPYIRLFAAKFPEDVCGLVFSDPTDFMLTEEENEKARVSSQSTTGYQQIMPIIMNSMINNKNFPQGAKYDAARALKANSEGYFKEYRNLPRLKQNIATTVIISYNKHIEKPDEDMNKDLKLGINFKPWWREYDNLRIQHFSDLIRENDNSMIILLPKYSHGIYYQNPALVAKLIQENYNSHSK